MIGLMSQDFGVIRLSNKPIQLRHTFTLKNQSDSPIEIKRISTTCGCTDASADLDRVPPGGITHVSATLTLTDSGFKQAEINIVTDRQEQSLVTLSLQATGRRYSELMVLDRSIQIQPGDSAHITVFVVNYASDVEPAPPMLTASEGLTPTFDSWKLVYPRDKSRATPARWQGSINIRASSQKLDRNSANVTISSDQSPSISIPVHIQE